jgi:nucleoside-diphosphate-sugar epimerase
MHREKLPNLLVTGGTGFVGSRFIELLNDKCCKYKLVTRTCTKTVEKDAFLVDGINSSTIWDGAFKGVNCIIHIAGLAHSQNFDEDDYIEVNTNGTLNLAKQAIKSGVKRFVFVSSIGVHGDASLDESINESSPINPHSFYTKSKYLAEIGLMEIANKTEMEVVIVRPTLVYGSNAPGNFGKLKKLVTKLPFLPFGFCNNKRSFISVDNLSSFLYLCATHPQAAGEAFVISDGDSVSIKVFTNHIASGVGTLLIQLPFPVSVMKILSRIFGKSTQANQLLGDFYVDSSKARELIGWTPPESMRQAMARLKYKK